MLAVMILAIGLVSAGTIGNTTVTFSDVSESGAPGDTVSFTIDLENTGTDTETISFSSTSLSDGTNTITAPTVSDVSLASNATDSAIMSVTIPSTASGTYSGTLTVSDADSNSEDHNYTVEVTSVDDFSLDLTEISIDTQTGETEVQDLEITNSGSETLSNWSIEFESDDSDDDENTMEDNDGDEINVDISDANSSLEPGESMTIEITFDVDSDMDIDSYDGTLSVSADGASSTVTETLNVGIDVEAEICEEGIQGSDFNVDIKEPDTDDDFNAGETITVEVEIENRANDDLDIEIEVILLNEDSGEKEEVVKEEASIDEDEEDTYYIEIELPSDLDEDDDYTIYVQVHEDGNEDDSCDYDSVPIDIERNDRDAQITDTSVSPSSGLLCEEDYRVSIDVESTGDKEIDNLYIEIFDGDLGISESSSEFDLGDHNDNDNDQKISFDFTVPADLAAGSYYLEADLFDEDGDLLDDELILVSVDACSASAESSDGDDSLEVSLSQDYDVSGEELTISLVVSNDGSEDKEINIDVEDVSWASLDGSEYLENLGPGDTVHAYLYFTLDLETNDEHSLKVTVSDDAGNEVSEIVTVDFGEEVVAEEDEFLSGITGWFGAQGSSTGTFWIIADIVLIILALVFLRMLFSKR